MYIFKCENKSTKIIIISVKRSILLLSLGLIKVALESSVEVGVTGLHS